MIYKGMVCNMEKLQGRVVRSKSGRDKGELLIILSNDEEYAYVANGDLRKVDRPKKKKLKHLQLTCFVSEQIASRLEADGVVENHQVRKALAEYSQN